MQIQNFNLRWIIIISALLIGLGSILYTNSIVNELAQREHKQIDLFTKVQSFIATTDDNASSQFLLTEIIEGNNSIPVILADTADNFVDSRNLGLDSTLTPEETQAKIKDRLQKMKREHEPLELDYGDFKHLVYYENSKLITQLTYYPYIQLSIIAIFSLLVYFIYSSSKASEQNRVWVGLAKETAHQLGTPLSSLMAWVEYLKYDESTNQDFLIELEKDVQRLEMITARFSSIGSVPTLKRENVLHVVENIVNYLKKRVSEKVKFILLPDENADLSAEINVPLFEWIIENICKNAIDAMAGAGTITIKIRISKDQKNLQIDIADTGKGIPKHMFNKVFRPGFTTKKRGWGLGLTLVKRIVENYHQGKIFVSKSEINVGTTFRIFLPKDGPKKRLSARPAKHMLES